MWRRIGEGFLKFYLVVAFIADLVFSIFIMGHGHGFEGFLTGLLVFVGIGIVIVLSATLLGIFLEMAKDIEVIARNTTQMEESLKNNYVSKAPENASNQSVSLETISAAYNPSSTWRCKHCDTRNVEGALFCKDCGQKR